MEFLERSTRTVVIAHCLSTFFMVGLIWTIHTVHYPLFAYVGDATYVQFQAEHVERIGKLLLLPWLTEGLTLTALLALAFLGSRKDLRFLMFLNGIGMAIVLVISGFWSAPAHGELANGFDASVHSRLMTANLIRTLAWTVCGLCALFILAKTWRPSPSEHDRPT